MFLTVKDEKFVRCKKKETDGMYQKEVVNVNYVSAEDSSLV